MRLLILLFLSSLVCGCTTPAERGRPFRIVNKEQIQAAVMSAGVLHWAVCESDRYASVDEGFLRLELPRLMAGVLQAQRTERYSLGDNDCSDFVRAARLAAAGWNHRTGRTGLALAIGELTYRKDSNAVTLHRVLMALGPNDEVFYYDALNGGSFVTLSTTELLSVEEPPRF